MRTAQMGQPHSRLWWLLDHFCRRGLEEGEKRCFPQQEGRKVSGLCSIPTSPCSPPSSFLSPVLGEWGVKYYSPDFSVLCLFARRQRGERVWDLLFIRSPLCIIKMHITKIRKHRKRGKSTDHSNALIKI